MSTFTNPYAPGTDAWAMWEEQGTKTLTPHQQALVTKADAAYDANDRDWFSAQTTEDLATLWVLVSGINTFSPAGSWDDEVYDALHARGHFN